MRRCERGKQIRRKVKGGDVVERCWLSGVKRRDGSEKPIITLLSPRVEKKLKSQEEIEKMSL